MFKFKFGKQDVFIIAVVVVVLILGASAASGTGSGLGKPQSLLSGGYPVLELAPGQSFVEIAVSEGRGEICAKGPAGQKCTRSPFMYPVITGDEVTFWANADSGFKFDSFQGPDNINSPKNPLTVTIVQGTGGQGYVHVVFKSVSGSSGDGSTTTDSGTWPTQGSLTDWLKGSWSGVPVWFVLVLAFFGLLVLRFMLR